MYQVGSAHFSLVVPDVTVARDFFTTGLEGTVLVEASDRCELSLWGHQLVLRQAPPDACGPRSVHPEPIDETIARLPHHGLVVDSDSLDRLRKAAASAGAPVTEVILRRVGTPFEHRCFFTVDPSGGVWEVKAFGSSCLVLA